MKARRARDGELATTGLTKPRRGVGGRRGQSPVLTFVLIKPNGKAVGFNGAVKRSVLDNVTMAGDTCLGNVNEQTWEVVISKMPIKILAPNKII